MSLEVESYAVFGPSEQALHRKLNPSIRPGLIDARQIRSIARGGDRLVIGSAGHTAALFGLSDRSLQKFGQMKGNFVDVMHVSADGRALMSSEKADLSVYDVVTGERVASLPSETKHHAGLLVEGQALAVSAGIIVGGLTAWDLSSGAKRVSGDVEHPQYFLASGPGSIVVSIRRSDIAGTLERVAVEEWDLDAFEPRWSVPVGPVEEPVALTALDVGRGGRLVAFGTAQGEVKVIRDGEVFQLLPLTGKRVKVVRFRRSVDADQLLVFDDHWTLRCFDVSDPAAPVERFARSIESHGCAASSWQSEGRPVIAGDRLAFMDRTPTVYVVDTESGEELGSFESLDAQLMALWDDGWLVSATKNGRADIVRLAVPDVAWTDPVVCEMQPFTD